MNLDITDAALGDLRSILSYTLERWGEDQESKYLDAMWRRFEELLNEPQHWRMRNDLFPGCRVASLEACHFVSGRGRVTSSGSSSPQRHGFSAARSVTNEQSKTQTILANLHSYFRDDALDPHEPENPSLG